MIISCGLKGANNKDKTFARNSHNMAEQMFIFGVVTGMFVFLVGIVFAARSRRYSQGFASTVGSVHGEG